MTTIKLFVLGATGYIGGSVLSLLVKDPRFEITALVRKAEDAKVLEDHKVKAVIGSMSDSNLLIKLTEQADVVLNFANADDLEATRAIFKGLTTGTGGGVGNTNSRKKLLIHTSGTGVLIDNAKGERKSDLVYSDVADLHDKIQKLPMDQPHRHVDSFIFDNGKDDFDYIIVCPPMIYGEGTGYFNRHSIQLPAMIRYALQVNKATVVGAGVNVWNNVHIEDLVDAYILILDAALEGKADVNREGGFYFVESGETDMATLVKKVGEVLYEKKVIPDPTVSHISMEEAQKSGWYEEGQSSNSRSKADRIQKLGWKPKRSMDIFASVEPEVTYFLERQHPVQVYQSIIIEGANREKIWSLIGNFFDLSWTGAVNRVEKKANKERLVFGSQTNFVTENLVQYRNDPTSTKGQSLYTYTIQMATDLSTHLFPCQVHDYVAELKVLDLTVGDDIDNKCVVVWTAQCKVASDKHKQVVQGAVTGLFQTSLVNLKGKLQSTNH